MLQYPEKCGTAMLQYPEERKYFPEEEGVVLLILESMICKYLT